MLLHQHPSSIIAMSPPAVVGNWELPARGLSVFHGTERMPRLSHYFLPRLLLRGRSVLYLDGANVFDPLLLARFARSRGLEPSVFNRSIRVARAFTCFQLTELLERLPRLLAQFPAQVAMVTALPEVYFDEDVGEADARASFLRALAAVRRVTGAKLSLAVFSDASGFASPRRHYFERLTNAADRVLRVDLNGDRPELICEKDETRKLQLQG